MLYKGTPKKNSISSFIEFICVGNIYLGGTGKTPLCVEIFSILKDLNMNPAFIRKQYASYQDEFELEKQIGPIYQNKKRIEAIKKAIQNNVDIVILDDGFQDFSVNKNLSIVCFNEKQWIGNGLTISKNLKSTKPPIAHLGSGGIKCATSIMANISSITIS